jgi:hypothetical protein
MKLKMIIAATSAAVLSVSAMAQSLNESGGAYSGGAMPVSVVANPILRDVLQVAQFGAGSPCIGNDSELCMPSVSSVELASVMQAGFGQEWGDYQITDFGAGAGASTVLCGTIAGDEATRVGARHIGMGCNDANPEGLLNTIAGLFAIPQANTQTCMGLVEGNGAGALGFAIYTNDDASHNFVKLDGQASTLANFEAGNVSLFGDVHGGTLPGQSNGVAMHASAGSFTTSNECASGRLYSGQGDLIN